ncbi:MAG: AAA family ATPase [Crenarchaeota archaeon]|nr:AAA family ATPase [Thermoproteota archaeon]
MRTLYIASMERNSGKTTIAMSIISELVRRGVRVVPYRPFMYVSSGTRDETLELMLELSGAREPVEKICPIKVEGWAVYVDLMRKMTRSDILETVLSNWRDLKTRYDLVLTVGYKSLAHRILGKIMEIDIAREIDSKALIVIKPTSEDSIGDVLAAVELAKAKDLEVIGVVFNCVRPWMRSIVEEWCKMLKEEGVDVLGIVDEYLDLLNPSIRELVEELQGKVIVGQDKLDQTYEHILVGAMTPDAALRYMRSVPNKIVITGGDRADIIMLALETDTRAIILTGGIMPSPRVIARAEERGVPLILVNYDTYTTISKIMSASGKYRRGDRRVQIVLDRVSKCINVDKIIEKLKER